MFPSEADGPRTAGAWWLPAGLALVCGALLAALVLATDAAHGVPFGPDADLHEWVLAHRPPWVRDLAVGVTVTGSGLPAYVLAALAGGLAARSSRWPGALLGVLALASAQAPRIVLASVLARPRPPAADWAWPASGWAMPSGHTTTSMAVAILICRASSARPRHAASLHRRGVGGGGGRQPGRSRHALADRRAGRMAAGGLLGGVGRASAPTPEVRRRHVNGKASPMSAITIGQAVILGVVEGVTEFLPVSSTMWSSPRD